MVLKNNVNYENAVEPSYGEKEQHVTLLDIAIIIQAPVLWCKYQTLDNIGEMSEEAKTILLHCTLLRT